MNEKQKKLSEIYESLQFAFSGMATPEGVEDDLEIIYEKALELLADEPEKSLRDYTLAELAELVHDMAKEKGWWDVPREWPEIACLIHSEISEAVECYRNGEMALHVVDGKPEGLVVELADVVIRCLDYLQSIGQVHAFALDLPAQTTSGAIAAMKDANNKDMLALLYLTHCELSDEGFLFDKAVGCVCRVFTIAKRFNLDLPAAIEAKIHYNATRPYRHGGKKA